MAVKKNNSNNKKSQSKIKRRVSKGRAYIVTSYNNTIVTLTDTEGAALAASSAGVVGFKGARARTPYAASRVAEDAVVRASKYGLSEVDVFISGPGMGRQMAVKSLRNAGLKILSLSDTTPIPHNGCRPNLCLIPL